MGTIIPNLLDYPARSSASTPKGENARITARHRAKFGPVHVLDPFGVTGIASAAFKSIGSHRPAGLDSPTMP
ncbi:type IV secretory system conjugative DNA transfer family protein [Novosphingobium sp. NBM11]|uniref:type IV secretory system conjugative DNA transfer family protein n=1 Tax=Novosphingobium sp. NBM11 TaxID=2596914 RepID=UPI0028153DAE|nr:type IV secretory system conjugative DNA transfer family protein [Novosphingobium sp. NBM11]